VETPVVETTPTAAPPVVSTTPTETETSLSDHEKQFGPAARREARTADTPSQPSTETTETPADQQASETGERDEQGKFKPRSEKQRATREDSPRIQELTRKWREAERERDELRQRLSTPPQTEIARPGASSPSGTPFSKPEPQQHEFVNEADPYVAWMDARQDWRLEKKLHEAREALTTQQRTDAQRAAAEEGQKHADALNSKIADFEKTHPDYWQRMEDMEDLKFPDVLGHAIVSVDNPPELAYYLATHPDDLVDLIGFSSALDLSQESVALLRRRFSRYTRATDATPQGSTGAPKPAQTVIVAPKPPTPVRTGPLKTGDEPPGDNDMSLANHEKFYGQRKRR